MIPQSVLKLLKLQIQTKELYHKKNFASAGKVLKNQDLTPLKDRDRVTASRIQNGR